jgi:hypothetical protein
VDGAKDPRTEENPLSRNLGEDIPISATEDILQRDGKEEWRKKWE